MVVFAIMFLLLCPFLSLPIAFVGLKENTKYKNIYLAVFAIIIALFSYSYVPKIEEDLSRHHANVVRYTNTDINEFVKDLASKPEQLSLTYKYIISKTGNVNLLQFFTSAMCYFILFYLLSEYAGRYKNVKGLKLFGICFFVISGFYFVVITSGIFYTLALEIFSLAAYFDYVKNKRIAGWTLYVIPIFIHTCAVLPLFIVILYKLLGSRFNIKNTFILIISILFIGILLTMVASSIDLPIVTELSNLYESYFDNEDYWAGLHTASVLALYLSRLIPIIVGYRFIKTKSPLSDFSVFMVVAISVLYFQTTFSIRYIHIVVLCGLPILFEAVNNKKIGQFFCVMLYGLAAPQIIYQIIQLQGLGEFENLHRVLLTNLITTFSEG